MTGVRLTDPDRMLALNYCRHDRRAALEALWALDETLGRIVASTTQAMIGQMRLTWWHERLCALDDGAVPAEPVLAGLARHLIGRGVTGAALAALVEGWEALLEEPLSDGDLNTHADLRGAHLFTLAATLIGGDPAKSAGRIWALADFARHCATRDLSQRALALAGGAPELHGLAKPLRLIAWLGGYDVSHGVDQPRPRWTILRAALA
jgi:15-cis-phytoene synthase